MMPTPAPEAHSGKRRMSAFPRTIEQLVPQAQRLTQELGRLPSQNQLKAALHIRAERAKAVLQVLNSTANTGTDPVTPDRSPVPADDSANAPSRPISVVGEPGPARQWPVILLAAPAFVAIWSGWVGVGELAGFGPVHPLPGIADGFTINSAITLPVGMETYAAYALRVWLAQSSTDRARRFARRSAITAFVLGGLGQIAYHLMTAAHLAMAPWPITTAVSCLPVVVLGFGAALAHLQQQSGKDIP
jgi:hypothetical protein